MDLQAVIFDMDGVLIDSWDAHKESWFQSAERRGYRLDEETFARLYGKNFHDWVIELGGGDLGDDEMQAWYDEKEGLYREIFTQKPHIMEGVEDLHRALHAEGIRIGVGSAGPRANVDLAISLLESRDLIETSVSADDVEHAKPAPDVFLEAARRLGVDPAACVVIEDSLSGLKAAEAAQMVRVGLAGTETIEVLRQHADFAVEGLLALNPAVLRDFHASLRG